MACVSVVCRLLRDATSLLSLMYQSFDIRAVKLALKLGNFHAAMPDKLPQEFFLIGTDSNKAELFHF